MTPCTRGERSGIQFVNDCSKPVTMPRDYEKFVSAYLSMTPERRDTILSSVLGAAAIGKEWMLKKEGDIKKLHTLLLDLESRGLIKFDDGIEDAGK